VTQQVDKMLVKNYLHRVTNSEKQTIVRHNVNRNGANSVAADLGKTWTTFLVIVFNMSSVYQYENQCKISTKAIIKERARKMSCDTSAFRK
jgi:hypothetical protein